MIVTVFDVLLHCLQAFHYKVSSIAITEVNALKTSVSRFLVSTVYIVTLVEAQISLTALILIAV